MQKSNKSFDKDIKERRNKILIDTNVIIYMYEQKKDIFDFASKLITDAEFYVLDGSLKEIDKVYKEKPRKLENIKKYLEKLFEINKLEILETPKEVLERFDKVDRILIWFSRDYLIYTNDKKLKLKLLKRNKRVLTLRNHGVYLN